MFHWTRQSQLLCVLKTLRAVLLPSKPLSSMTSETPPSQETKGCRDPGQGSRAWREDSGRGCCQGKSGGHQSHGTTCGKDRCLGDCHGSVRAQEGEEALGNSTPSACSCPRWGGSGRKSGDAAAGCAARQAPTHDRRARGHIRHLPRDHPAVRVAVPLPRTRPPPTSASGAQLSAAAQDVTPALATSFLEAARHRQMEFPTAVVVVAASSRRRLVVSPEAGSS